MTQPGSHGPRRDDDVSDLRLFRVRARHEDIRHGRLVWEATFEAAAVAFLEHHPPPADGRAETGVVVHDVQSGHEHSFLVRLPTG